MRTAVFQIAGGRRRRGSTYVLVLGVAVILTVIGLSSLTVARINTRAAVQANDWGEAQALAFSGAEYALAKISSTGGWRAAYADRVNEVAFGRGALIWRVVDGFDGSLTDDEGDPVDLLATGTMNEALYKLRLRCFVVGDALEALNTALHAGGQVTVDRGQRLKVAGAALSTNGHLKIKRSATLDGDAQADRISIDRHGEITGDANAPVPPRLMPASYVFEMYKSLASHVQKSGTISRIVLSPAENPWGTRNANGIYCIDVGNHNLTIKDSRIHGTLVVKCRKLRLEGAVLLHSLRQDYPVLIVDGDVEMSFRSKLHGLSEFLLNRNLNPPGTPYNGQTDGDKLDVYPNEIRGLVHVKGSLQMKGTALVRGLILCEGSATFKGHNEIVHVPSLHDNPPLGYTTGPGRIAPQMWTRVVD